MPITFEIVTDEYDGWLKFMSQAKYGSHCRTEKY